MESSQRSHVVPQTTAYHSRKSSALSNVPDLMGQEQKKLEEERIQREKLRQQEDTQSVFEIRKLFKFDN